MKRYILATVMAAIVTVPTIALATGKNILSVHILDQQTGKPAPGVEVILEQKKITDGRNSTPDVPTRMGELKRCGLNSLPCRGLSCYF